MSAPILHSWDLSPREAVQLQKRLAESVDTSSRVRAARLIAGADVSYRLYSNLMHAGIVVWDAVENRIVDQSSVSQETSFAYVPGLLTFREAPAIIAAFEQLRTVPDVLMMDGQGIAHPRRLGIAAHLGIWLDFPTIGCAKSHLAGQYQEPDLMAGSQSPMTLNGKVVGAVLRTRDRVKPLYISPGHKITIEDSVAIVLASCRGYRLPEPTRLAHQYVNTCRRSAEA